MKKPKNTHLESILMWKEKLINAAKALNGEHYLQEYFDHFYGGENAPEWKSGDFENWLLSVMRKASHLKKKKTIELGYTGFIAELLPGDLYKILMQNNQVIIAKVSKELNEELSLYCGAQVELEIIHEKPGRGYITGIVGE